MHRCFFCSSDRNIVIPEIVITASLGGESYSFCSSCLESMSAFDFWREWVKEEYPEAGWPPAPQQTNDREYPTQDYVRNPRKIRNERTISLATRYRVLLRDGGKCVLCGADINAGQLVIDHINPVSNGGTNTIDNLRTLCFECNAGKGAKTLESKS